MLQVFRIRHKLLVTIYILDPEFECVKQNNVSAYSLDLKIKL